MDHLLWCGSSVVKSNWGCSRLRLAIGKGWFALTQHNLGMAVNNGACEATRGEFNAKSMGSPASTLAGFAPLVFPVVLMKEGNVDPPDNH